jgi:WD40 repeat protein
MKSIPNRRRQLKLPSCYELAVSRDGKLLASLGRNIVIADTYELKRISSSHPFSHPSSACFNQAGTRLAVKNTSGQIIITDPVSSEVILDFNNKKEGEGAEVLFSPCDDFLVDASWNGYIRVRSSLKAEIKDSFFYEGEMIREVSCSQTSDTWLFVHQPKTKPGANCSEATYLTLWTWPLVKPSMVIHTDLNDISNAVISPDGRYIAQVGYYHANKERLVQILRADGTKIHSTPATIGGTGSSIRWSPDGTLIGSVQDSKIIVYQSGSLSQQYCIDMKYPSDIAFSPDNSYIAFSSWDGGLVNRLP